MYILENDILARLQKGETVDEIATSMTRALNTIVAHYNREKEREEAAKKEKEARLSDLAAQINNNLTEYFRLAAPDLANDEISMTAEDMRELMDDMISAARDLKKINDIFAPSNPTVKTEPTDEEKIDEAIKQFLKTIS